MGFLTSICPECGEKKKNKEVSRCTECNGVFCMEHYKPKDFIQSGVFKDKEVVHYMCPRCGGDNGKKLTSLMMNKLKKGALKG